MIKETLQDPSNNPQSIKKLTRVSLHTGIMSSTLLTNPTTDLPKFLCHFLIDL